MNPPNKMEKERMRKNETVKEKRKEKKRKKKPYNRIETFQQYRLAREQHNGHDNNNKKICIPSHALHYAAYMHMRNRNKGNRVRAHSTFLREKVYRISKCDGESLSGAKYGCQTQDSSLCMMLFQMLVGGLVCRQMANQVLPLYTDTGVFIFFFNNFDF